MTLSSELFLTPAYTAPQGSSRDSLAVAQPSADNGLQKLDKEAGNPSPIKKTSDNSNDRFKDHLARETNRDSGKAEITSNTMKETEGQITENNPQADKNSEGTAAASTQKENIRAETEAKNELALMVASLPNGNKSENSLPPKQEAAAHGNSGLIANIRPDFQNNLSQNNIVKAEGNITEASKAQSTENTGKILENAAKLATINISQATSAEKTPPVILSNAAQSRALLSEVNIEGNPKADLSTGSMAEGVAGQSAALSAKQANILSGQNTSDTDPALTQKTDPQKTAIAQQSALIQKTNSPMINGQNSAVQDEVKNLPAAESVTAAQALTESSQNQSGTPQHNLATVPVQATNQRPGESLKDSAKTSLKGGGNSPASEGSDSRNQAASSENMAQAKSKGSSKNSAESQYSSQNSSSASTASPANNQNINSQMGAKAVPFQAELNAAMTNGDIRPSQLNSAPLQATLLSVQEAGQQNNLASTSHIKPPTLPVTPQMVTKQISMAILKQAGNGLNSFKLSLKPAELGQVNIRMDFQADGKVTTAVIVDNDRTLALLQRDQGALNRALENAGFNMAGNDLNFTLKKQQHNQNQSNFSDSNTGDGENEDLPHNLDNIVSRQQLKMAYSDNALDINI